MLDMISLWKFIFIIVLTYQYIYKSQIWRLFLWLFQPHAFICKTLSVVWCCNILRSTFFVSLYKNKISRGNSQKLIFLSSNNKEFKEFYYQGLSILFFHDQTFVTFLYCNEITFNMLLIWTIEYVSYFYCSNRNLIKIYVNFFCVFMYIIHYYNMQRKNSDVTLYTTRGKYFTVIHFTV